MFDKILQWPNPVTADNALAINVSDAFDANLREQNTQLDNFVSVIENVKTGLDSVASPKAYQNWGFNAQYSELLNIWADFLNRIRQTAEQQPTWLQTGYWSFNGTQVGPWNVNFDASNGSFIIGNDPYLTGADQKRQRDFGLLYEIGRDTHKFNSLVRGGKNSALTKAAIQSIEDKAQQATADIASETTARTEQMNQELETATADKVAQIKTVEAAKNWSGHYEDRCAELEELINGKEVTWLKFVKIKKPQGLRAARRNWYILLITALGAYAYIAFQIIHGVGAFKISSNLDATLTSFGRYFIGLTLYGLLAGIYVGYSFSVKQLKVHQNLLEQYRHRAIVAKTIESIVYAVIKTREGNAPPGQESALRSEDLDKFVQVAATSMFEYRPIGHLSTKEGTSMLGDLFNGRSN